MRVRNPHETRRLYPSLGLELDPGEEVRIPTVDELPDGLERVDEPRRRGGKTEPDTTTEPAGDKPEADDEENA